MVRRRRLDARYLIRFPVHLIRARQSQSLITEDVSEGGVFLRTDSAPPLLQLVQVQLVLPIGGHALRAHGMTVHVVAPDNTLGHVAGIGVQFYALDRETREAWEGFTRHVAANYPESTDQTPLRLYRGVTPEPLSRRFGHHTAVLELKPPTVDALEAICQREAETGDVFVPTPLELPDGAVVVVHVRHPVSGAPFLFEARVTERTTTLDGPGVKVSGMGGRFREDLLAFVRWPIVDDV